MTQSAQRIKKILHQVHLWLGLGTGLVVFIVSITGCLYAFQKEIQDLYQDYRFTEVKDLPVLPPSVFEAKARGRLPEYHLHAINYPGTGKNVEAIFYGLEPEEHYFISYHDPYTAEIVHVQNMYKTFFQWVLIGHYYLWLPPVIGQPLVAYSTLLFVIMLLTGLVLWFPRNKAAARQRFWFRWKSSTRWKRKNYDLHNILGFYSLWLLLVVALTGMIFGIQWFRTSFYAMTGGKKSTVYVDPVSVAKNGERTDRPVIDLIWEKMQSEHPDAVSIEVHTIESDTSVIAANANSRDDVYWTLDYRYFDQYTLEEIPVDHIYGRLHNADGADKLLRMNYDIHVGAILGFPGKILAFLLSLTAASLPVTGTMVWWGRRRKNKSSRKGRARVSNGVPAELARE
ncbi:MAG: PepSY-associated TM helix domain-containing protein [Saprospiraceae bacterium]|nr:PepSY domain-containing protein [Lewinella sp.]